jgi:hypothetical protein
LVQRGPRRRLYFPHPIWALALANHHHLLCLLSSLPPSPSPCREETAPAPPRVPPPIPTASRTNKSAQFAGHSRRKFVTKPRFFFPFFFRSPAPVFPFDSAAGSAPLLLRLPDCLFSSERAVSRGRRSRIRLRKRRFGPQVRCGVLPNFAPCGAAFDLFRWRRDDGFGEISLASVVLIGDLFVGVLQYSPP